MISIITINFNNATGLIKTMESVFCQKSDIYEYIIVDGESTDESVDIVKQYAKDSRLTKFNWISEKDNGIYHAMNKGIEMAKGEYLHFLNSGDWLVDENVVEKMHFEISNLVNSGEKPDIFVGNRIIVRPDGKIRIGRNENNAVTALTFYRGTIDHTSAYIRRTLFDLVGLYDENLRIVSDWKWYFEAVLKYNAKVIFTNIFVSYFDNTGISSTNLSLDKAERRQVIEHILPRAVLADYDNYHLAIDQNIRLKRYPLFFNFFYFVERVLFKFDKWKAKYWGWKSLK